MAGRLNLGLPRASSGSLRAKVAEQVARTTLHRVRSQGHPYVELREDRGRFVFFCTLCLSPCYSDTILIDHLRGNLHSKRLSTAKLTLLKPNPWPFNDGVHFFGNSSKNEQHLAITNGNERRWLESKSDAENLGVVEYGENFELVGEGGASDLVVQGVLLKDGISDLKARFIGFGKIAARFHEKAEGPKEIRRIWCEWLGKKGSGGEATIDDLDHEFSVVTFAYCYNVGRTGLLDNVKSMLNGEGTNRKRKKTHSDPEDMSQSLSNQYDSSEEDYPASNGASSELLSDGNNHLLDKTQRREVLKKQHQIAAERICSICQQKMLQGKDVATLVNMKRGKLACGSRNMLGAFHLFHTSCLIHWVLLCEFEIVKNRFVSAKVTQKSRRKKGVKCNEMGKDGKLHSAKSEIFSVFCPECQGTGLNNEGDELEDPTFPLAEMFKYKIKVCEGHREWMKNPEVLQNCSTGFHFPSPSEQIVQEEKVLPLKLLRFYRAEE